MRRVNFTKLLMILQAPLLLISSILVFHFVYNFAMFLLSYNNFYLMREKGYGVVESFSPSIGPSVFWNLTKSFFEHTYSDVLNLALRSSTIERTSLGLAILIVVAVGLLWSRKLLGERREITGRIRALSVGEYQLDWAGDVDHTNPLHALDLAAERLNNAIFQSSRRNDEEILRLRSIAAEVGSAASTIRGYAQLMFELGQQQGKVEQVDFANAILDKVDSIDEQIKHL